MTSEGPTSVLPVTGSAIFSDKGADEIVGDVSTTPSDQPPERQARRSLPFAEPVTAMLDHEAILSPISDDNSCSELESFPHYPDDPMSPIAHIAGDDGIHGGLTDADTTQSAVMTEISYNENFEKDASVNESKSSPSLKSFFKPWNRSGKSTGSRTSSENKTQSKKILDGDDEAHPQKAPSSSPQKISSDSNVAPEASRSQGWMSRLLNRSSISSSNTNADVDPEPLSEAEFLQWTDTIAAQLNSGNLAERIEGCTRLQKDFKGPHSLKYRQRLGDFPHLIPTLLTLGQRGETAIPAVYTLQIIAASMANDGIKDIFDSTGTTNELVDILMQSSSNFGLEVDQYHRLLAHTLATLLNLCINCIPRKDKCLSTTGLVHRLNELLYSEGPGSESVQMVCANLISSLAIGSSERKETLCSAGVIPHLAQLTHAEKPLALRVQAVVSLRAVMHNKQDRQLQAALQPQIIESLRNLASTAPEKSKLPGFKEVSIALKLILSARSASGIDDMETEHDQESVGTRESPCGTQVDVLNHILKSAENIASEVSSTVISQAIRQVSAGQTTVNED